MKSLKTLLLLSLVTLFGCTSKPDGVEPVNYFDLEPAKILQDKVTPIVRAVADECGYTKPFTLTARQNPTFPNGNKELVNTWWNSPNRAFAGKLPSQMWETDSDIVYTYVISHFEGEW